MYQPHLFDMAAAQKSRVLVAPPCSVVYFEGALPARLADRALTELSSSVAWKQEFVQFYGKRHAIPRLTAWFGDAGASYTYSKISNDPLPWTPILADIRDAVEEIAGTHFNSVLLNLYRTGKDSVAWHADDEPELGARPMIASVSLGSGRLFQLRRDDTGERVEVRLQHGSVLLMSGDSQRFWQHQVPKEPRVSGQRINLTFRVIDEANCPPKPLLASRRTHAR